MKKMLKPSIKKWAAKIDWHRRVKAVCKPCWELKYCPYGLLIEEFPLPEAETHRACRIFGHECPVFLVAEPLTETKELGNISRHIPRPIQFRVLKRENQVCRSCGKPVADDDIHFDHIIPWSKGGSTEESNIQLLCGTCNRKKSDKLEEKYLIARLGEHLNEPVDISILEFLLFLAGFRHYFFQNNKRLPSADDIANEFNSGKKGDFEKEAAQVTIDLESIFGGKKPKDISENIYKALMLRWGYKDYKIRKLSKASKETGMPLDQLLESEIELVEKLGWRVKDTPSERKKWIKN
ncbi:MAG: HNH endonuclease signature motif containing protein [Thermodesulfobacteriota bacterium]|jgi:hypothetical protein|nr:MAG: HNH endonuclease signature motif containing protein [Thermodesulfobacteriota bacterium]